MTQRKDTAKCEICQFDNQVNSKILISSLPPILIISCKRFIAECDLKDSTKDLSNIGINFDINHELDMKQYCTNNSNEDSSRRCVYKLVAVVKYIKIKNNKNDNVGHYYTYMR